MDFDDDLLVENERLLQENKMLREANEKQRVQIEQILLENARLKKELKK